MRRGVSYEDYFDQVVTASLRLFSICLLAIYGFHLVHRYLYWPDGWARDFSVNGLLTQLSLLLLVTASLRIKWRGNRSGAAHGALLAWTIAIFSSLHYQLNLEPRFTNIVLLTLVGCGVLLLDSVWTPITVAGMGVIWLGTLLERDGHITGTDLGPLVSALLLTSFLYSHRRKLLEHQFSLLENQRAQNELLAHSLNQAKRDQAEFESRAAQRAQAKAITLKQLKSEIETRLQLERVLAEIGQGDPLGRLAGGVAHDFANLITILRLNIDELSNSLNACSDDRELLQQSLVELQEIDLLVKQLLAYSRKQTLSRTPVKADELLAEFVENLAGLLPENIELITDFQTPEAMLLVDRAEIQQALLNLCLNSSEAMPKGGILKLSSSQQKGTVTFTLEDTGTGMEPEVLVLARDPYFTTKGFHTGRGLGLSVVEGILDQHDGRLTLNSAQGTGTVAQIVIPLFYPQEPDLQKVLLVEDEETYRILASRYLKNCGYTVLEAENASQARSLFLESSPYPGLLVTDVVLPDEDGYTLAEYLTQLCPALRVLVTSSHLDTEFGRDTLYKYRFLAKPYGFTSFREQLEAIR